MLRYEKFPVKLGQGSHIHQLILGYATNSVHPNECSATGEYLRLKFKQFDVVVSLGNQIFHINIHNYSIKITSNNRQN